ncbi:MAG: HDOD domain-containing protein [Thiobacillus sp.]|nr:HDOD domain-containing protein [Thiobacillus sp.]
MKNPAAPAAKHQEFRDPALKMAVRIPSPPPLLDELNRLLDDPNAGMEDIAKVVQTDAGLTASLFRTLAKPVYGLRRPPETAAQAISIVGLRTVAELVKGLSLEAAIYGDSAFYPWFWERANDIARYARAIAWKQRTVCNLFPEHAQLAALFMDCGVPILIQHIEKYEYAFVTAKGYIWPNVVAEDTRFDTDHSVVGYLAARHWKMPDYVCQAVRWHHDPINVEDQAATLIAILQTAKHIYNVQSLKDDSDWPRHETKALEEIGVAKEGLKEFEEDIIDRAGAH